MENQNASGKENTESMHGTLSPKNQAQVQHAMQSNAGMAPNNFMDATAGGPVEMDELQIVYLNLNQIEAMLKAESKRRIEANHITDEYIKNYLDGLEKNLN